MAERQPKKTGGARAIAEQIAAGTSPAGFDHYAEVLHNESESENASALAARVLEEVASLRPELAVPKIGLLIRLLGSDRKRVAQACSAVLPVLARTAPAKVAKHLEALTGCYGSVPEIGQDGLVRTYAALCAASVAYQKRLIDVIERSLLEADPARLHERAVLLLPVLKGEPHAQARAAVEQRLDTLPRPQARRLADFLGVKLRPARG